MPSFSRFILASGSPRRRELLASLGVEFEVIKSDIDETTLPDENPYDYVRRLSQEKAAAVATDIADHSAIILAADTVVLLQTNPDAAIEILGKPQDADEARAMLSRLRGRQHTVCTAFTLLHGDMSLTRLVSTFVFMRDYKDDEIEAYIASGDPFDKAGSYAIQNEAFHPVERINGSYNNVVGLPICAVRDALLEIGYPLDETETSRECDGERV